MAKNATATPAVSIARDNANTALISLYGDDNVSGWFTSADYIKYPVRGTRSGRTCSCVIISALGEHLGTLELAGATGGKLLATGTVEFEGATFPVCATKAQFKDGSFGLNVFPDTQAPRVNFVL